jgi:hypothetical protein
MRFKRFGIMILLCALPLCAATPKKRAAKLDVFESFRLFDAQFTKLDDQFHDLQQSFVNDQSKRHGKRAWQRVGRQMETTTSQISGLSYRMYSPYRGPSRKLRYRMFVALHRKTKLLHKQLALIAHTNSRRLARSESAKVHRTLLDLVLQYQALSGGYAAASCNPGKWNCGIEKKEPRLVGYPQVGVKWTCAPRASACRGILGPRTPLLAQQPLTTVTTITNSNH